MESKGWGNERGVGLRMTRIAYADPPYPGMSNYYKDDPCCAEVDHALLMAEMEEQYDAWALSTASTTLQEVLAVAPKKVRVASWVKPFCSFKPGVSPAYTWEPVVFRAANRSDKKARTDRDHFVSDVCSVNITLKKGLVGAKPPDFCYWLFDLLGMKHDDEFVDLYPGTGGVTEAWLRWSERKRTGLVVTGPLFDEGAA